MAKARDDKNTMDLWSWQPTPAPAPIGEDVQEAEQHPNGKNLSERISRAVADALRECDLPRDEIVRRMREFLGESVSVHSLNQYASQARDDHNIPFSKLVALCHAIGRSELLDVGARAIGARVVHGRYVPAIESAIARDRAKELRREAEEAERIADRKDRIWKGR